MESGGNLSGTLNWHPEPGVMLADFTDFTPSGANFPNFSLSHYQTTYMIFQCTVHWNFQYGSSQVTFPLAWHGPQHVCTRVVHNSSAMQVQLSLSLQHHTQISRESSPIHSSDRTISG